MNGVGMIIDISNIIKDNYSLLLKDAHKSHILFWLFFNPLIISTILVFFNFRLDVNQLEFTILFVSIIVGFMINISVILITTKNSKGLLGDLVKSRSFANIFYTVLIGIFLILAIIIEPWLHFTIPLPKINLIIDVLFFYTIFLFSLFIHFIVMILVSVKTFYALHK